MMLTAITDYGWPPHQLHPLLETTEAIQARQFALEEAVEADEVPTVMLDPRQFIPTQRCIDTLVLQSLVGVEFVPAVIVIRWRGKLYLHDGHHRSTRALLDGGRVRSVIFDPNEETL